jgi:CDGSH-type Zn-finger protein
MENVLLPKVAGTEPIAKVLEAEKKYSWCTCGLSKNQPLCDGVHKQLFKEIEGEMIMPFKSLVFSSEVEKEVYLCTCKHTKNPPYCDGSHHQFKK